jgi:Fic family protein
MASTWIWLHPQWPQFAVDLEKLSPLLSKASRLKGEVLGRAAALGLDGLSQAMCEAWTAEAVSTAAIEGQGLNPQSVRSSVARRLGLDVHGGAAQQPIERDAEGLIDVLGDATLNFQPPLTALRLKDWQAALFPTGRTGLRRIDIETFRTSTEPMQVVSGRHGRLKVHHEAPPSGRVSAEIDSLLAWLKKTTPATDQTASMDGVVRAAIAHLWFETIHPFDDGNGRVGRAIVQWVLSQDLGAPARVLTVARQIELARNDYYLQLEAAQRYNSEDEPSALDVTPWCAWFAEQFCLACVHANKTIDVSLERLRFLARQTGKPLNARQHKVLSTLLDAGPGGFEGGMTTRKYAAIAGAPKITAARDLAEMLSLGYLAVVGAGRSTRYYPAIDGWV